MNLFKRKQAEEELQPTGLDRMNNAVKQYDFLESINKQRESERIFAGACFGVGKKRYQLGSFESPFPVSNKKLKDWRFI